MVMAIFCFFDDSKNRVQLIDGTDEFSIGDYRYVKQISLQAEKIKRPFDITQHEWSDVIAEIEPESGHTLVIKSHGSWLSFDKDDVIAMARDRGLTAEDLK